jgi:hypothetical protein
LAENGNTFDGGLETVVWRRKNNCIQSVDEIIIE